MITNSTGTQLQAGRAGATSLPEIQSAPEGDAAKLEIFVRIFERETAQRSEDESWSAGSASATNSGEDEAVGRVSESAGEDAVADDPQDAPVNLDILPSSAASMGAHRSEERVKFLEISRDGDHSRPDPDFGRSTLSNSGSPRPNVPDDAARSPAARTRGALDAETELPREHRGTMPLRALPGDHGDHRTQTTGPVVDRSLGQIRNSEVNPVVNDPGHLVAALPKMSHESTATPQLGAITRSDSPSRDAESPGAQAIAGVRLATDGERGDRRARPVRHTLIRANEMAGIVQMRHPSTRPDGNPSGETGPQDLTGKEVLGLAQESSFSSQLKGLLTTVSPYAGSAKADRQSWSGGSKEQQGAREISLPAKAQGALAVAENGASGEQGLRSSPAANVSRADFASETDLLESERDPGGIGHISIGRKASPNVAASEIASRDADVAEARGAHPILSDDREGRRAPEHSGSWSFHPSAQGSESLRARPQGLSEQAVPSPIRQVVDAVAATGSGQVELRLEPEELGRVRFHFRISEHGFVLQISAERPETLEMLRRNVDQLARYMGDAGYEGGSFSFSGGRRDGKAASASTSTIETEGKNGGRSAWTSSARLEAGGASAGGEDGLDLRL